MKFSIATAAILLLTVTACDNATETSAPPLDQAAPDIVNTVPYPEEMRTTFMTNCVNNGGTDALCSCVLTEMEKAIPADEMKAAGEQTQSTAGLSPHYSEKIIEANVRCALESTDDAVPVDSPESTPESEADTVPGGEENSEGVPSAP